MHNLKNTKRANLLLDVQFKYYFRINHTRFPIENKLFLFSFDVKNFPHSPSWSFKLNFGILQQEPII